MLVAAPSTAQFRNTKLWPSVDLAEGKVKRVTHPLWVPGRRCRTWPNANPSPYLQKKTPRKRACTEIPQCAEGSQSRVRRDGGRRQEVLLRPCGSHQRGLHFPENKGRAIQRRGVASTSATEEQGGGAVLWPHTPPKLGDVESSKQHVPILVSSLLLHVCYVTHTCAHTL